jgi:hypothetical protein
MLIPHSFLEEYLSFGLLSTYLVPEKKKSHISQVSERVVPRMSFSYNTQIKIKKLKITLAETNENVFTVAKIEIARIEIYTYSCRN